MSRITAEDESEIVERFERLLTVMEKALLALRDQGSAIKELQARVVLLEELAHRQKKVN